MSRRLTRRIFIQSAAAAGAALSLRSSPLRAAAGEKLNVASVGVGGKGWSDLKDITASPHVNIVAICDVDERTDHLGRAAETFPKATRYSDWRKLLEQGDIEAVHIATPDHLHAPVALAALALGKPVYCQKPLTHTVFEARTLTEAARKAGVVTQMGNQIQSHLYYRTAVQLVHDGAIGKVKEVFTWQSGKVNWRKTADRPAGADPVPATLAWNNWLGPAPERPYKEIVYHPFNWRAWQDFSNGQLGDFGCHLLDPVFKALELSAPISLTGDAAPMNKETWPYRATVHYEFPGTKHCAGERLKLTWYDGESVFPPREALPIPSDFKLHTAGSLLVGEKGSLLIPHVQAPKLFPEDKFRDYKLPEPPPRNHYISWVNACRGEDRTTSSFDYAGPLTETVLLGTIALRLPRQKLGWNAAAMKIEGPSEANEMLTKQYRKGWELPV